MEFALVQAGQPSIYLTYNYATREDWGIENGHCICFSVSQPFGNFVFALVVLSILEL